MPWPLNPSPGRASSPQMLYKQKICDRAFRIKPEAARQFDVLKAEVEGVHGKDKGPALIAEALNLLFEKYGKPRVA